MSKFKIINLIDKVFVTTAIFLIVFGWINFYLRSLWTSFILSTIISLALVYILYFFMERKQTKTKNEKASIERINLMFLAFKLSTKEEKIRLLNQIYSKSYQTKVKKGVLFYEKENKTHQIILATHIGKIDQHALLNLMDENIDKADCYEIICENSEYLNTEILAGKKVEIINKNHLYSMFFNADIYPNVEILAKNINKPKFKDIVRQIFNPIKSKSYFFCGLILIFSSIILPYHYYYIIFGSMLLLFSVICKLLPKFKD